MCRRHRVTRFVAIAVCVGLLTPVTSVMADDVPPAPPFPDDVAAVSQYRESVPTVSGKAPSAPPSATATPSRLAPRVQGRIARRGGRDKKLLTQLAASAPRLAHAQVAVPRDEKPPGFFSAVLSTMKRAGGPLVLLVVLLAVAAAGFATRNVRTPA